MTRISSLASNTLLVNQLLKVQTRLFDLETQVATEKVSQDYKGIALDSQRLIGLENTRDSLSRFIRNNTQVETRLNIVDTTVEGIRKVIQDFKNALDNYDTAARDDPVRVKSIQDEAFRSLKSLEDLLNLEIDGRFLFSGARVDTPPVNLGLSNLAAFQARFDGSTIKVPTTRDTQLADFAINQTAGFASKTFNSGALKMTFNNAADTVTAAAGTFRYFDGSSLPAGAEITFSGATNGANNSTFQIASVSADGSTVTLAGAPALVDETATAATATARTILTFTDNNPSADTVTGPANTFKDAAGNLLGAGTRVAFSNTASNNAIYTIASVSADGATATLIAADAVTTETARSATASVTASASFLTFERDNGATPPRSKITGQGAPFANVKVGTFITIAGTAKNNGTYEVLSVPSSGEIIVRTEMLADETVNAAATTVSITAADGTSVTTAATGNLTIVRDNGVTPPSSRITAANANSLAGLKVGQKITVAGSGSANLGVYTVAANNGTSIDIVTRMLTNEGTSAAPYFTFTAGGVAGNMNFVDGGANADTIVAPANTFKDASGALLPAGAKITVSGTGGGNDGKTFTIASVSADGGTVTLASTDAVTAVVGTAGTLTIEKARGSISATPYYGGDLVSLTHRVSADRDFEIDLNAVNPAFEKAIRAMKIILQGSFQSEGGLDQNAERIGQAQFLLNSSLRRSFKGTPPFGSELKGSVEQVQIDIGFNKVLLDTTSKRHADFIGFLDAGIANVENSDPLDVITRLLDDQRALEASYQALARIKQLSLINFI